MPSFSLYCDSHETTLSRAYSKMYNGKSGHISIKDEYVKQLVKDGVINIIYVKSSNNLADLLTKRRLRDLIRIKYIWWNMGLKPFMKENKKIMRTNFKL